MAAVNEMVTWDEGDIRDLAHLHKAVARHSPEIVFHLAAQSLVRKSYEAPISTFDTNVIGTANVLEASRHSSSVRTVVIVTSDKCYENADHSLRAFVEDDPLGGQDPYSASKACAELVVTAFRSVSKLKIATARAGNVIGGGDWAVDRLVPDLIRALSHGEPALIRNPSSVRPWQHVLEPLAGYLALAEHLHADAIRGGAWNFGPAVDGTLVVSALADEVCRLWGDGASWALAPGSHPQEARYLTLDATKAREQLAWKPKLDWRATLDWTVRWYKAVIAGASARAETLRQLHAYSELVDEV